MSRARPICFMLLRQEAARAFSRAWAKTGNRMAARIAIIAITTSNSISVKPLRFIMPSPSCAWPGGRRPPDFSERLGRAPAHYRAGPLFKGSRIFRPVSGNNARRRRSHCGSLRLIGAVRRRPHQEKVSRGHERQDDDDRNRSRGGTQLSGPRSFVSAPRLPSLYFGRLFTRFGGFVDDYRHRFRLTVQSSARSSPWTSCPAVLGSQYLVGQRRRMPPFRLAGWLLAR